MSYSADDMIYLLTDASYKGKDGNIYKLFQIIEEQLKHVSDTEQQIRLYRSIDTATGKTLDLIGSNYSQERGQATDEIYRTMIKSKIARMWSSGDFNAIINALATTIQADPTEFEMTEDIEEEGGEPGVVSLVGVPVEALNKVGMTIGQFKSIVKSLLPAGVRVESVSYEGTFEFGENADENYEPVLDFEKGFADDEQTTGGYLGYIISGNDYELPL